MDEIVEKTFERLYDRNAGCSVLDAIYKNCSFESCVFSMTNESKKRSMARNLIFKNCSVRSCTIHSAIIEDVIVDGLKTSGLLQMWGPLLRHVVLKGKIGRVMISRAISLGTAPAAVQHQFDLTHQSYYKGSDWALDISEGHFEEMELQGIPTRLIRRDPQTQVVIRRSKVLSGGWQNINLTGTHWATSLDFLAHREDEDAVLVAGKAHKNFTRLKEGLDLLVETGIAER